MSGVYSINSLRLLHFAALFAASFFARLHHCGNYKQTHQGSNTNYTSPDDSKSRTTDIGCTETAPHPVYGQRRRDANKIMDWKTNFTETYSCDHIECDHTCRKWTLRDTRS